jgi:hypothetical protein
VETQFSYNKDDNIVILRVAGDMGIGELGQVALDTLEYAQQQDCFRVLGDMRRCNVTVSIIQLYQYRTNTKPDELQRLRRALVFSELTPEARFFEDVSVNRGQPVRVFTDMDAARAWLVSGGNSGDAASSSDRCRQQLTADRQQLTADS